METCNCVCKCVVCGKRLENDDAVWEVNIVRGVERWIEPACSLECAKKAQQNCLDWFDDLLACVRNQKFEKTTVRKFLGPLADR